MKRVVFICVHNSCRSQIAEALGKHLAGDKFESYSAGTETRPLINQDAVRLMKQLYGIDMEKTQRSKLLNEIPPVNIITKMILNPVNMEQISNNNKHHQVFVPFFTNIAG